MQLKREDKPLRTKRVPCKQCQSIYHVPYNAQDWVDWKSGKLIQMAMPYLSDTERELLISGLCGWCFDDLFPPEED